MGPGAGVIVNSIRNSLTPRTWAAYASAWDSWSNFVSSVDQQDSVDFECVGLGFVSSLLIKNVSPSHISKLVAIWSTPLVVFIFHKTGFKGLS